MKMDVEHGLAGAVAVVNDHPVAALFKAFLGGDFPRDKEEVSHELPVRHGDAVNVRDMLFGNDERVDRRLGIDVLEGDRMLVLVDDRGRDLLFDDPAENAVRVGAHDLPPLVCCEKLRKKQHLLPVWHAGPVCSTLTRSVSWSQS